MQFKRIAKITKAELFIEDHGIMTAFVYLDFGGSSQGFGGYSLDSFNKETDRREGTAAGADWVLRLLNTFKVSRMEELHGKPCYALYENEACIGKIIGLKQIEPDGSRTFLIEDWLQYWKLQ